MKTKNQIELFNDDCIKRLTLLEDKSINLTIIDPPYLLQAAGGGEFGKKGRAYRDELNFISKGFDYNLIDLIVRKMVLTNMYIFANKHLLFDLIVFFKSKYPKFYLDILTWNKTNPVPACGNAYLPDTEYILFVREKGAKIYGTYKTKSKLYQSSVNKADKITFNHPTCKPVPLLEKLIINSSKENELVLDCFMGSGSTGEAALNLKRNFVGIELNKEHFKTAKKRLKQFL